MNYLKLLRAKQKSGNPPTMKRAPMSEKQKQWAKQGICINCGENKASKNVSVCKGCQEADTLEDIQKEIQDLRLRLLNKSNC